MNARKKILVVEDDTKLRYVLQSMLEQHGCDVVACSDAQQARQFDGDALYAAVIDVRLPDERGDALAHYLKEHHGDIKIVFITAYDDLKELDVRLHGASLLVKPFSFDSLWKLL